MASLAAPCVVVHRLSMGLRRSPRSNAQWVYRQFLQKRQGIHRANKEMRERRIIQEFYHRIPKMRIP